MSQVKIDVNILNQLTNNEAASYFSLLSTMDNEGKSNTTIENISALGVATTSTLINHFQKFKDNKFINIDKGRRYDGKGTQNYYSYTIPSKSYITIDTKILDLPITKNQLGLLIRLKANTIIGTNIIPFSLNKIVKKIGANHNAVYDCIKNGVLERYEDNGFRLVDESIFLIN